MKRWLWWLLVALTALPGAVLLFLWELGVDANPYAEDTPQWLWYIPLLTPLLMVGTIYGAGRLVAWFARRRRGTWTGWVRALVCLATAGLGALVAYGVVLSVLYFGLLGSIPTTWATCQAPASPPTGVSSPGWHGSSACWGRR